MASRIEWVDNAKGLAIIGVVAFHAASFLGSADSAWRWEDAMGLLVTVRMPVFFFASGIFAAAAIGRSWGVLVKTRLAKLLYLYVLWSLIRVLYFQEVPFILDGSDAGSWTEFAQILFWPHGGLWFLYALALYLCIARATASLPVWMVLGSSAALAVVFSSDVTVGNTAIDQMLRYLFFYLLAVRLGVRGARRLDGVPAVYFVASFAAWAALTLARVTFYDGMPGVRFVTTVAGVAAGVGAAVVISRADHFRRLSELGRQTLPIYLLHYLPIAAAAAALDGTDMPAGVQLVAVPLLTVGSIMLSLSVWRLTRRVGFLYDVPGLRGQSDPNRSRV